MSGRRRRGNPSGKQVAEEGELGGGCGEGASSEQPRTVVTAEEGGGGGAGEGGSVEQQTSAVAATEAGDSGGAGEGGSDEQEQPRAGMTAEGGEVAEGLATEDAYVEQMPAVAAAEEGGGGGAGEGGSDEQPRAAVTADAKVSAGASYEGGGGFGLRAIDGQPRTVATAEERQGHVGADGGGSAGEQIDGVLDAWKAGCFLLHAVMKWGVEDVMNSDLYKEQVNKVPSAFSSVEHYLQIHSALLLEEIRASLQSEISASERAKSYHVLSVVHTDTPDVYYIDIDVHQLGSCSHVAEDGDIFFLGELKHMIGCFAIVVGVGRNTGFHRSFRLLIPHYHNNVKFDAIKEVTFLTNIMEGINLSKAMRYIKRGGSAAVESVLCIAGKVEKKCILCDELAQGEFVHAKRFNDEQLNAVKCITSKLLCPHINALEILWGPPGSGKTRIAIGIIQSMFNRRSRMLVCLPSEKYILRFLHSLKDIYPSFNLSMVLVLNDVNAMKNCSIFGETSLESRAHVLFCCTYMWGKLLKETAFVLEMKPYCKDNCDHEGQICTISNLAVFSSVAFRKKVRALASDIRKCSKAMLGSLLANKLSDNDIDNVNKLNNELSCFDNLLLEATMTNSEVHRHLVSEFTRSGNTEPLIASRAKCLQLIEILIDSVVLPQLEDINDMEEFCIANSCIIISTPSCSSRLLGLKSYSVDVLVVDDAAQIRESDLLIPLSLTPRHIVLLGDHLHLQSIVKSEVCREAGYACSLFERLLLVSSENKMLTKQYLMSPTISKFVCDHFYKGLVEEACTVKSFDYDKKLVPYGFFDITAVDELKRKGNAFVENAVIIFLLQILCKCLRSAGRKLTVCIVCLCSKRVDAMRNFLSDEYRRHEQINLEINSLDNLYEKWYDVVILSAVVDSESELPKGNKINTSLTRSRYFLWIIGEATRLLACGDTWNELVNDARERHCVAKLNSVKLSKVMEKWGMNLHGKEDPTIQKTSWLLFETKRLCSCLNPPQVFTWHLCSNNLKHKYEEIITKELASEESSKRGKLRLETGLDAIKEHGVIGSHKDESKTCLFKIESYEKLDVKAEEETESLVEAGNIMIGTFRVSRNYFYLKPGETYVYDVSIPYIHPKSFLPASHAVMVIGHGKQPLTATAEGTSEAARPRHVNIQNSYGRRFGVNGFGRVSRCSLRGLYKITVPELPQP
uniref:DNA2/NAM7 helicase helicase domain-containing protein n=1 Tax=Setaria viridis TaxID=4556 RepID=A0A4U6WEM1_SETVI|nr:hypothetical protein SEVIR_1G230100v2 [Setaria viridis]